MRRSLLILPLLFGVPFAAGAQQLLVFPAVTDHVQGRNGSVWETNIRLVKIDPDAEVIVRRRWVCLPEGGFVDDPDTTPRWRMRSQDPYGRVVVLDGEEALHPSGSSVGAVALEIEGGELTAHAYVADSSLGESSALFPPWLFGQGQLVPAMREPLSGPSHIPRVGGCLTIPCAPTPPERWSYFRNNIGLVNPNPEPLTIEGTVVGFGYWGSAYPGDIGELPAPEPERFVKTVPPYGWTQFHWESFLDYSGNALFVGPPANGFVISLAPGTDQPYYAYTSVVFSPDPATGAPAMNDPLFVPAEPGAFPPLSSRRAQHRGSAPASVDHDSTTTPPADRR